VHNYLSGDSTPSDQDVQLTQQLYTCGEVLEIKVLDHVIIGFSGHVSLRDLDKDNVEKQSCLNLGNLERINLKCEVFI